MDRNERSFGAKKLGDTEAVAGVGVGFVAEQAGRHGAGDGRGLPERDLRLEGLQTVLDDAPELGPLAAAIGFAAGRGGAERAEVGVGDAGFPQASGQGGFGEPGAAAEGEIADVDQVRDACGLQSGEDGGEGRVLVADRVERGQAAWRVAPRLPWASARIS